MIKNVDHQVFYLVFEKKLEVAASASLRFVCIIALAGTREGLAGPREFLRQLVGVCDTE